MAAQPSVTTESEDSAAARANAEQEAIDNAAEAAATPAPGREDLEPAEPGFDDNTIDNEVTLAEAQEQSEENSVSARSLKKEYGPCVLNPSALHIRTDPRPDGDTGPYVAFKPQTQCGTKKAPIRVSSIHHHGRIMYKYYTKWNQAAENDVSNTNSSSLLQKKLEEKCDGTAVNTLLWGSVQGTIVYNGKTYHATVKPPQKKLDCRVH
ncbi:hypothetical protein KRX55_11710 [Corynebacterium sp. TAE3-ERU16]|nr:hypothetical protein [Corynebacterium sp. TAE3-ERU16]